MTLSREPIVTWDDLENVSPRELWRRPLSTTQAAEELGINPSTIRRWIESGIIPARRIGRNYQIPRQVIKMIFYENM